MLPNRTLWTSWNAFEKASYVAQIAVIPTLFLTSLFSWLSWREASLARADQAAQFMAEKLPDLELLDLRTYGQRVHFVLKNQGDSLAKNVRVIVFMYGKSATYIVRSADESYGTLEQGYTVPKQGEMLFFGFDLAQAESTAKRKIESFKIVDKFGNFDLENGGTSRLRVNIDYEDLFGNRHAAGANIEVLFAPPQ